MQSFILTKEDFTEPSAYALIEKILNLKTCTLIICHIEFYMNCIFTFLVIIIFAM